MKLCEITSKERRAMTAKTGDTKLETVLKRMRDVIRNPNSGVDEYGKQTCEKIIDTLLASSDDEKTFTRYYEKFLAEHPDAMDFLLDDIYSMLKVENSDEFFKKIFP